MSDDACADWAGSGGKVPPIMGAKQTLQSYAVDCENWLMRVKVDAEKCGPLVLTRGPSRRPRLQDIGKKFDRGELQGKDGLRQLLAFVSKETGESGAGVKINRFRQLISPKRGDLDIEPRLEQFAGRRRLFNEDGLSP